MPAASTLAIIGLGLTAGTVAAQQTQAHKARGEKRKDLKRGQDRIDEKNTALKMEQKRKEEEERLLVQKRQKRASQKAKARQATGRAGTILTNKTGETAGKSTILGSTNAPV